MAEGNLKLHFSPQELNQVSKNTGQPYLNDFYLHYFKGRPGVSISMFNFRWQGETMAYNWSSKISISIFWGEKKQVHIVC